MSYTHLLFDMDDTILDFQKAQIQSFKSVLKSYGIQFNSEAYCIYEEINHDLWRKFDAGHVTKDYVQITRFDQFFKRIGYSIDGNEANEVYQSALSTQTFTVPYAEEVCAKLSKSHKLFIVTNGVGKTQEKRFRSSSVFPYFSEIFISEKIGVSKPNEAFFLKVFSSINFNSPENILLIGDSLSSDIKGANNIGIDCCWFNPKSLPLPTNFRVTFQIKELRELLFLI